MSISPFGNGGMNAFAPMGSNEAQFQQVLAQTRAKDPQQAALMEYQHRMEKEQQLITFISNMMKKLSEMNMAIINNIR